MSEENSGLTRTPAEAAKQRWKKEQEAAKAKKKTHKEAAQYEEVMGAPVEQPHRVALVIGMSQYPDALANAANDAIVMAQKLKTLAGFQVTLVKNGNRDTLVGKIQAFLRALQPNNIVLFYYAGHGMVCQDRHYMMCTNYEQFDDADSMCENAGVSIDGTIDRLANKVHRGVVIALLDTCRSSAGSDNRGRARLVRGPAAVTPNNSLMNVSFNGDVVVGYACARLATAGDGEPNGHGVYTKHLLQNIFDHKKKNILNAIGTANKSVQRESRKTQEPRMEIQDPTPFTNLRLVEPSAEDHTDTENTEIERPANIPAKAKIAALVLSDSDMKPAPGNKITLVRPPKLKKLSPELAAATGQKQMSFQDARKWLYQYVKEHELQDPNARQYVLADDTLKLLTGKSRFLLFGVQKFLKKHLLEDVNRGKRFREDSQTHCSISEVNRQETKLQRLEARSQNGQHEEEADDSDEVAPAPAATAAAAAAYKWKQAAELPGDDALLEELEAVLWEADMQQATVKGVLEQLQEKLQVNLKSKKQWLEGVIEALWEHPKPEPENEEDGEDLEYWELESSEGEEEEEEQQREPPLRFTYYDHDGKEVLSEPMATAKVVAQSSQWAQQQSLIRPSSRPPRVEELKQLLLDGKKQLRPVKDPLGFCTWDKQLHFYNWEGLQYTIYHKDKVILTSIHGMNYGELHGAWRGCLPASWGALVSLETLKLGCGIKANCYCQKHQQAERSHLRCQLPSEWSTLTALTSLQIRLLSSLTGPLPTSWSVLTALEELRLDRNQGLTGRLPREWSTLTRLTRLSLWNNQLDGPLPREWAALSNLRQLYLGHNNFKGRLPSEWSRLTRLEQLLLSQNQLDGPLPPEWAALSNLRQLKLSDNEFSKPFPAAWNKLRGVVEMIDGFY